MSSTAVVIGALRVKNRHYVCRVYFVALILFWMANPVSNVDPDQMPHYVASDLGLHCLSMTFYGFPGKNGLTVQSNLS